MSQWDKVLKARPERQNNGLDEAGLADFDADGNLGASGADASQPYRFTGVAPPQSGRGALKNPMQLQSINVLVAKPEKDAGGKDVIWFEIAVVSAQYEWSVRKRFSECVHLHDGFKRLQLARFSKALGRSFPDFPSRFHVGSDKNLEFVEKRRSKLDGYFRDVFEYLKEMHLASLGIDDAVMLAPLSAAFQMFIEFLRSTSKSHGKSANATAATLFPERQQRQPGDSETLLASFPSASPAGSPSRPRLVDHASGQRGDTPASKLLIVPGVRFVIALLVPGIPVADVYVELLGGEQHGVLIGGKWNTRIECLMTSGEDEALPTTAGSAAPSTRDSQSARKSRSHSPNVNTTVLMDTLPTGEFEMVFEIPPDFDRNQWYGEHSDGVLFLIWNKVASVPA